MPLTPEQLEARIIALEDSLKTLPPVRPLTDNPLSLSTDLDDLGSVKTHLDFAESPLTPTNPPADTGLLHAKDENGQTMPFWISTGGNTYNLAYSPFQEMLIIGGDSWDGGVTGTGAVAEETRSLRVATGTTASSTARFRTGESSVGLTPGVAFNVIDWSRRFLIRWLLSPDSATTNGESRLLLGKTSGDGVGDLGRRGIGIRIDNLALKGQVHDGTDLTTTSALKTLTENQVYDLLIVSDGSGTVEWFLDGTSLGTSTGGPSTASAANETRFYVEAENNADSAEQKIDVFHLSFASPE